MTLNSIDHITICNLVIYGKNITLECVQLVESLPYIFRISYCEVCAQPLLLSL